MMNAFRLFALTRKSRHADFSRYRGLARASGLIFATLAIFNLLGILFTGADVTWIIPSEEETRVHYFQQIGERLAGVQTAQAQTGQDLLGVTFGFSTVREGIDPSLMEEIDPSSRRWLNLGTSGTGTYQMNEQARLFLRSQLTPDIVIFGVHPYHLMKRPSRPPDRKTWITRMRNPVNHLYHQSLLQLRLSYLDHYPIDVAFFPDSDPWAVDQGNYPLQQNLEALSGQIKQWESYETFASDSYDDTDGRIDILNDLIQQFTARGSRVWVLLMPESTLLRNRMPTIARDAIVSEYKSNATNGCYFFNLREAIDDAQFSDYVHLNENGRETLTRLLIDRLLEQLEDEK